jgi:hypothetical protein
MTVLWMYIPTDEFFVANVAPRNDSFMNYTVSKKRGEKSSANRFVFYKIDICDHFLATRTRERGR